MLKCSFSNVCSLCGSLCMVNEVIYVYGSCPFAYLVTKSQWAGAAPRLTTVDVSKCVVFSKL